MGAAPPIRDPSSTAFKRTTGSSTRQIWAQSTAVPPASLCPGRSLAPRAQAFPLKGGYKCLPWWDLEIKSGQVGGFCLHHIPRLPQKPADLEKHQNCPSGCHLISVTSPLPFSRCSGPKWQRHSFLDTSHGKTPRKLAKQAQTLSCPLLPSLPCPRSQEHPGEAVGVGAGATSTALVPQCLDLARMLQCQWGQGQGTRRGV